MASVGQVGDGTAKPVPADAVYGYYLYPRQELPAVAGYTNVNVVVTKSAAASLEAAELAQRTGSQVIVEVSDWPSHWRDIVRPYAEAGVLHSVHVADEPMGQGMRYEELARRIAEVHAEGWKAYFVEEGGHPDKPHPAVDFYGFDCYYLEGAGRPHSFCEDMIRRHPEINVYVAYSFYNTDRRKECGFSYDMPDQRAQVELARRNRLGVLFFTWIDYSVKGCHYTGVGSSPEAEAVHRAMWAG